MIASFNGLTNSLDNSSGTLSASPLTGHIQVLPGHVGRLAVRYEVRAAEPVLAGHFPGFPIFPGVCLAECAHQAVRLALAHGGGGACAGLAAIERARFLRPVFPGDEVRGEADVAPVHGGWRATARLSVYPGAGGDPAVAATFQFRYGAATPPPPQAAPEDGSRGAAGHALGTVGIKRLLPHRYPMLLIDRVAGVTGGTSLVAVKAVTASEPWYARLGDEADDAYPLVLLAESWCQAAGVLACLDQPNPDVLVSRVALFGAITGLRLYRAVRPGDQLEHRVRLLRSSQDTAVFEGETLAGREPVMSVGSIIIALRPADALRPPDSPTQPLGKEEKP